MLQGFWFGLGLAVAFACALVVWLVVMATAWVLAAFCLLRWPVLRRWAQAIVGWLSPRQPSQIDVPMRDHPHGVYASDVDPTAGADPHFNWGGDR